MRKEVAVALLAALLAGCTPPGTDMAQNGLLTASDGTKIAYSYWAGQGAGSHPGVILVSQLSSNRHSWDAFGPVLQKSGYAVIAIDYRGRGDSGGRLSAAQDFLDIALDVDAAKQFLAQQLGVDGSRLAIIGASIGANHALRAGVNDPHVRTVVLLSAGLDYRGVKTAEAAEAFRRPLLIVASEEDAYAAESSRSLNETATGELIMYRGAGHGTDMLHGTDLKERIVNWLKEHLA